MYIAVKPSKKVIIEEKYLYNQSELDCTQFNGKLSCSTHDGMEVNGIVKDYYESGALKREENRQDGWLVGTIKFYDSDGNLIPEQ